MSERFVPSDEQRLAIEARGDKLLISAGAGSGKTRVLTERLLSYLKDTENPCDINEFLIITYTRAAAAELRERIRDAIIEEVQRDPRNRRLRRQAALVYSAQIDTIHGFCGGIVRENAHALGLSHDFRIAEEDEAAMIASVVMDRVLDERYEKISEFQGFEELVNALAPGRDDLRLGELALGLYKNLRAHDDERGWVEKTLREMRCDGVSEVAQTMWGRVLVAKARRSAEFWLARLSAFEHEIDADETLTKKYGSCFGEALQSLRAFLAAGDDWDAMRGTLSFGARASSHKSDADEEIKRVWGEFGKEKKALLETFFAPSAEIVADMGAVFEITEALFALVSDFAAAFHAEKLRRRIVDFSDLEHYALTLLSDVKTREPTTLARDVSQRFVEIMVDEYQDVSMIQERIFNAVSREGRNLVTVGDMRQSIYRFRLAEPSIFREKYNSYAEHQLVRLTKNFRSREAVLDAVNYVFSNIMSLEFGEMEYTEREFLHHGLSSAEGGVEVEFDLIATGSEEDSEVVEGLGKREIEARFIASRIRELTAAGEWNYRDCVILLRAMTSAGIYREALAQAGIPVAAPPAESYLETAEVGIVLAFLAIVDNPRNDIPLVTVLRSHIGGFSPDELAEIRLTNTSEDCDFFSAFEAYAEDSAKTREFLAELRLCRELAPEFGAERMLWRLYNREELPAVVSAMPQGFERRGNLMRLIRDARRAAAIGYVSVAEFLRYIERMRENGARPEESGDGDENAVRIMTIHKSKGLEFPVVFVADCSKKFRKTDEKELLVSHRELGIGIRRVDLLRKIAYSTLPRIAIIERLNEEQLSEELRVLYVAMTRARERLFITHAEKDADKLIEKLEAQAAAPYLLAAQPNIGNIILIATLAEGGERFINLRRISAAEVIEEYEKAPFAALSEEAEMPETRAFEEFQYAFQAAVELPSKLTVTEVKNRIIDETLEDESETSRRPSAREFSFEKPKFLDDSAPLRGAERGTALHLALRHLELREYSGVEDLRAAVEELCRTNVLTREQADAADIEALMSFFSSDLGRRAAAATEVYREFAFSILVPASTFYEHGGDDKILFQGCVDLAFCEGESLTIVDFKSDKLWWEYGSFDTAVADKLALYEPQLRAYAVAMERVTGRAADTLIVYFLDKNIAEELN